MNIEHYLTQSKLLEKTKQTAAEIEILEEGIALFPQESQLYFLLGIAQDKVNDIDGVINSYSQAIALNHQQPFWVYATVIERLQWQNQLQQAIHYSNQGIKLYPYQSELYRQLALVQEKLGNVSQAIVNYLTVIKLKPTQPISLYSYLLKLLKDQQEFETFYDLYDQLITVYPDHNDSSIYSYLGEYYSLKNNFRKSIEAYTKSLEINSKQENIICLLSSLHFNIGVDLLERKNIKAAIKQFEKVTLIKENCNLKLNWLKQNNFPWAYKKWDLKKAFNLLLPPGKQWPKITVVTPSFNQAQYIEQTILSVINQEYDNLEYIVVDGSSDDGTAEVLSRYENKISHTIIEADRGQSDAINKGFDLSTGELMTWLNSDDLFFPGALYMLALTYLKNQCDMIAGICIVHRDSEIIATRKPKVGQQSFNVANLSNLLHSWSAGHFFFQPETIFTRKLWLEAGGKLNIELNYAMDHDLWLRFARVDAKLEVVNYPIALFRKHDQQKTANSLASISELTKVVEEYHQVQIDPIRQSEIINKFNIFSQSIRPNIAIVCQDKEKFSSQTNNDLQTIFYNKECCLFSWETIKRIGLKKIDLVILIPTSKTSISDICWVKESNYSGILLAWLWTDEQDYYLNRLITKTVDICIPKSELLGKIIRNNFSFVFHNTNDCLTECSKKEAKKMFATIIENKLFDDILMKTNKEQSYGVDLRDSRVFWFEESYFGLSFEARFTQIAEYKVCVLPLLENRKLAVLEALLCGLIVVVVGKASDIEELFLPGEWADLSMLCLYNDDHDELSTTIDHALSIFKQQGISGRKKRHNFVLNNHLLVNRLNSLFEQLPTFFKTQSKSSQDKLNQLTNTDMTENQLEITEAKQVQSSSFYLEKAQGLLDSKPKEAASLYQQAISLHPDDYLLYRQLGVAQEKQGNIEGQIKSYVKAIALESDQPYWVYSVLVNRLQTTQQLDKAVEIANQGIELYPDKAELYRNLGVVQDRLGDTHNLIKNYFQAIKIDEKQPFWVYCALAENLCWKGRASEAEKVAKQGIKVYPERPELLRYLGLALRNQGKPNEAIKSYTQAIQFGSDQPAMVYESLVTLYREGNNLKKAIDICQQAIEVLPEKDKTQFVNILRELTFLGAETNLDNFEFHYNQGKALSELERWDEAIVYFKKAIAFLIRENKLKEADSSSENALIPQEESVQNGSPVCGKYKTYPNLTGKRQDEGGLRLSNIYKRGTKEKPLVTIITAVYNNSKSFERCINSVIDQEYDRVEYLVIDGGSDQPTLDIIYKYKDKIDYFVSEPDSGIYNAMNKGIELAQGDYVCVLNSDDWYSPDFVSSSVEIAQSKDSSVVYTYCNHGPEQWITPGINEGIFLTHLNINHASFLVSKDCYNRIGKYSEDYLIVSDMLWKHDAFQNGEQFDLVPDFLFNFSHGGLSSGSDAKRKELMFSEIRRLTKQRFEFLSEDESDEIYKLRFDKNRVSVMLELIEKHANQKLFVASLTKYIEYCFKYRDNYKLSHTDSNTVFPLFIEAAEKLSIPKYAIRINTKYGCFSKLIESINAIAAKRKNNTKKVIIHFVTQFSTASETFIYDLLNRLEEETVFDNYILFDRRVLHEERPYEKCLDIHWAAYRPEVRNELYKHIFATINPDVVIAHFALNEWKLQQRLAPLNIAVPTISMTHGIDVFTMSSKEAYKTYLVENFSKRENTFFTTVSHYLRRELEKYGIPKDKISVIPNTVNKRFFEHRKSNYFQKGDTLKLLNLGRLIDWKGHIDLLQGVKYFQDNCYRNLHLTIVYGYGEDYYEQTVAEIERLNLTSKVTLKSFVDLSKEPEFFSSFDLYIQSSTYSKDGLNKSETFGVAVLEAITAGLPVIVTDAGGLPEVVGKENKFAKIVPHDDGRSIGKALQELFDKAECFSDNREYAEERLSYFSNKKQTISLAKEIIKVSQKKLNATLFSSVTIQGAGYAAFRVHRGLRFTSINPTIHTKAGQHRSYPNVKVVSNPTPNVNSWNAWNILQAPSISKPELTIFSINHPFLTSKQITSMVEKADLVSLHWTARFLSIENIAQLSNMGKPLLMTIRDMNPITGGCHYFHGCSEWQHECANCPQLVDTWDDYPSKVLNTKRRYYNFENITIVTISNHTAEIIKRVPYFNQCRIEVITNSIETDVFKPYNKVEARKAFGLPLDRKIVAYVPSFSSTVKGYREAIAAFKIIAQKYQDLNPYIMLLGDKTPLHDAIKFDHKSIGFISDNDKLAMAYSAADVTIVPSLEETFSNTTAESISCGTPVVGFKTGAIPDMAKDGITGYTYAIGDAAGLAEGIYKTLTGEAMSENCRQYAEKNLSLMLQARKYEQLFYELYTYNKMPNVSNSQPFPTYFEETTPTAMNLLVSRLLKKT